MYHPPFHLYYPSCLTRKHQSYRCIMNMHSQALHLYLTLWIHRFNIYKPISHSVCNTLYCLEIKYIIRCDCFLLYVVVHCMWFPWIRTTSIYWKRAFGKSGWVGAHTSQKKPNWSRVKVNLPQPISPCAERVGIIGVVRIEMGLWWWYQVELGNEEWSVCVLV